MTSARLSTGCSPSIRRTQNGRPSIHLICAAFEGSRAIGGGRNAVPTQKAVCWSKSTSRRGDNRQMIHRQYVEIPPDKTLLPKLGLGGYSIPQAIAELIDNAIDAQIEASRLHVEVSFDASRVVVTDDGAGMSGAGLRDRK